MTQATVTLQTTFSFDGTSGSSTAGSITVAAGEGLGVAIGLEVADSGKRITNVDWNVPTPQALAIPSTVARFEPTHGKVAVEFWWLADPTDATDNITVTVAQSQKVGVTVFTVANFNTTTNFSDRQTNEGTDDSGAVNLAQNADDLGLIIVGHTKTNGLDPISGELQISDFDASGFQHGVFTEDGDGTIQLSWQDAGTETGENATLGFVIEASSGNTETLTATATGVANIQLAVAKTLAVTAAGSSRLNRTIKKQPFTATAVGLATIATLRTAFVTAAATAIGVATIATLRTAFVTVAATAVGAVNLVRLPKLGLNVAAAGITDLVRTMKFSLGSIVAGVAAIQIKAKKVLATSTGGFLMFASEFDGTNDWLERASNLTGIADSKVGLISLWYRSGDDGAPEQIIFDATSGAGVVLRLHKLTNDILELLLDTVDAATTLRSTTTIKVVDAWKHVLISWDVNSPGRAELYIDDIDVSDIIAGPTDANIGYTNVLQWAVGAKASLGTLKTNGCVAQFYFNSNETLDLSVEANRRKFINANLTPVDLGPDGSNPTGNVPIIYLDKAPANFHLNDGTGGDFTQNGTLTECPPPHGAVVNLARKVRIGLSSAATGVVALGRKIFKTLNVSAVGIVTIVVNQITEITEIALAVTATAVAALRLKTKKTLASTASAVTALNVISTFLITVATAATGIATLTKKAKLGLPNTAVGTAALAKKAKLGLSASATGVVAVARKAKLILRASAAGVVAVVVNALEGATLLTLTVTATAISALRITVKKTLQASSTGVATLIDIPTFRVLVMNVATGVVTLIRIPTFKQVFSVVATGVAGFTKKPKLNLGTTAVGVASINRTIFKTLRSAAVGVPAIIVNSARFIVLAVAAVGIATLGMKVRRGLSATGAGVANIGKFVSKTLRVTATGAVNLIEVGPGGVPAAIEAIKTRIIGFFGGPGQGPGR